MSMLTEDTDLGAYLRVYQGGLNIISIFDELRYDRSDADIVSPAMRMHLVGKLKSHGFRQQSGRVLKNTQFDICCLLPKNHALGASPFDIADYCPRRDQDYYALTPTQAACLFIKAYEPDHAIEKIKGLIATQPINVLRLQDYLEYEEKHQALLPAIGHLRFFQRKALESSKLKHKRSLTLLSH